MFIGNCTGLGQKIFVQFTYFNNKGGGISAQWALCVKALQQQQKNKKCKKY